MGQGCVHAIMAKIMDPCGRLDPRMGWCDGKRKLGAAFMLLEEQVPVNR